MDFLVGEVFGFVLARRLGAGVAELTGGPGSRNLATAGASRAIPQGRVWRRPASIGRDFPLVFDASAREWAPARAKEGIFGADIEEKRKDFQDIPCHNRILSRACRASAEAR